MARSRAMSHPCVFPAWLCDMPRRFARDILALRRPPFLRLRAYPRATPCPYSFVHLRAPCALARLFSFFVRRGFGRAACCCAVLAHYSVRVIFGLSGVAADSAMPWRTLLRLQVQTDGRDRSESSSSRRRDKRKPRRLRSRSSSQDVEVFVRKKHKKKKARRSRTSESRKSRACKPSASRKPEDTKKAVWFFFRFKVSWGFGF